MDGIVIYVAKDRSRAIIWCSDQGPLGLARRDAMPGRAEPPLQVGESVRFAVIEDCGTRICGRLQRLGQSGCDSLPGLLRQEASARQRRAALRVIPGTGGDRLPAGMICG